jgi:(E)-4-hydroxy-3-methylbut-2-enyl-diphosphate synthase
MKRQTRTVMVGKVGVGGSNPIRIQSMTTSKTRDVEGTVEQVLRLEQAGCEIVRVTVQGMAEAKACEHIKSALIKHNCDIPLVADIHFYPPAAMCVVDFVDKVRINPGNFAKHEQIEDKFVPLIEKCKKLGRSMRIGTNLGSLSDRIMQQYGDTPKGMVVSAVEYLEICRKHDFHDIIFSMKASNVNQMVDAYRLLIDEIEGYPLHLGVTEAGEGGDGRIKSAAGIGCLLLDGLGDTIRISLTEDPWNEIVPCKQLIEFVKEGKCDDHVIAAAAKYGKLLIDEKIDDINDTEIDEQLKLDILQATGKRITKTEFISCPGCGRTLYDIQEVTRRIKARMSNYPGIKIAIMGCIVNGPGEMADADFGFVGSKPGKIDLYKGKICVERDIDFAQAEEKLEKLVLSCV